MIELNVQEHHLHTFKAIIDTYYPYTTIPKKGVWQTMNNNQIWLALINQVMVVGGVTGSERFQKKKDLKELVSYETLQTLELEEVKERIHLVLHQSGVRYVGEDISKSHKTKALLHNFLHICSIEGRPKEMLQQLGDYSNELQRVNYLMKHLMFMKSKSARDFLMGTGMNFNTLAIDIRIQNIFLKLNIPFPNAQQLAKPLLYNEIERKMIEKICKPLGIEPVVFDRILFQHYNRIQKEDYKKLTLAF